MDFLYRLWHSCDGACSSRLSYVPLRVPCEARSHAKDVGSRQERVRVSLRQLITFRFSLTFMHTVQHCHKTGPPSFFPSRYSRIGKEFSTTLLDTGDPPGSGGADGGDEEKGIQLQALSGNPSTLATNKSAAAAAAVSSTSSFSSAPFSPQPVRKAPLIEVVDSTPSASIAGVSSSSAPDTRVLRSLSPAADLPSIYKPLADRTGVSGGISSSGGGGQKAGDEAGGGETARGRRSDDGGTTGAPAASEASAGSAERERHPEGESGGEQEPPTAGCCCAACIDWFVRRIPRCVSILRCCAVLASVVGVLATVLVLVYYPVVPDYSLCNDKVAWGSLLRGLVTALKAQGTAEFHVAVWNPNRYDLTVKSMLATVFFRGVAVGSASVGEDFELRAGHVNDLTFVARMDTTLSTASSMLAQYLAGSLLVDLNLDLETQVAWFDRTLYAANASFPILGVNVTSGSERHLCRCQ